MSLSLLQFPTSCPGAAGATVAAFLGFRPLLPPPPPTAFRFPLPTPTTGAATGAGVGPGAMDAGLGAIGRNLSMILPICHAAPACGPATAEAAPYLGARQHPPFLSILRPPDKRTSAHQPCPCFLGATSLPYHTQ